VDLSLRLTAVV
jgi:hypothetical protein